QPPATQPCPSGHGTGVQPVPSLLQMERSVAPLQTDSVGVQSAGSEVSPPLVSPLGLTVSAPPTPLSSEQAGSATRSAMGHSAVAQYWSTLRSTTILAVSGRCGS